MSQFEALQAAVERAGSQSALARTCGVTQTAVWKWLQSSKRVPPEHVLKVEAATGVSRHLLRPDIYPPEHVPPPFDPDVEPPLDFGPIMSRCSNRRESNRNSILDERPAA